jgi:hypothetical protein
MNSFTQQMWQLLNYWMWYENIQKNTEQKGYYSQTGRVTQILKKNSYSKKVQMEKKLRNCKIN